MALLPREPVPYLEIETVGGGHWSLAAQKLMKNAVLVLLCLALPAFAADGLIAVESARGAKDTMDRLESAVKEKGLSVFVRVEIGRAHV